MFKLFTASDSSETETETASETETETEDTITPRTEGRLRASLRKSLPKSSSSTSRKHSSKSSSKPVVNSSFHHLPEILPPIVFHADFGVRDDLSIMERFVGVVQPGVDIPGADTSRKSQSASFELATTGVNGGVGLIGNPESVVASTSGTRAFKQKSGRVNTYSKANGKKNMKTIASIAAMGTGADSGVIKPLEAVVGRRAGAEPRRQQATSSSGSDEGSEADEASRTSSAVVITNSQSVARVLSAPASRQGSRSSSRQGSCVNSRSPSPAMGQATVVPSKQYAIVNVGGSATRSMGSVSGVPRRSSARHQQLVRQAPYDPNCSHCKNLNSQKTESRSQQCVYCTNEKISRSQTHQTDESHHEAVTSRSQHVKRSRKSTRIEAAGSQSQSTTSGTAVNQRYPIAQEQKGVPVPPAPQGVVSIKSSSEINSAARIEKHTKTQEIIRKDASSELITNGLAGNAGHQLSSVREESATEDEESSDSNSSSYEEGEDNRPYPYPPVDNPPHAKQLKLKQPKKTNVFSRPETMQVTIGRCNYYHTTGIHRHHTIIPY